MKLVMLYTKQNSSRNNDSFIYHKEVSFYNKRIDLIQVRLNKNEKFPKIHAIEFKISNWGRCLYQAKCNRLFFPYNSIAIWKDFIHRVKQNELIELGIGLIEVDYKQSKIVLEPKSSTILDKYLYKSAKILRYRNVEVAANRPYPTNFTYSRLDILPLFGIKRRS